MNNKNGTPFIYLVDGVGTLVHCQNFTLVLGCVSDQSEREFPLHPWDRWGECPTPKNEVNPDLDIIYSYYKFKCIVIPY